MKPAFDQLQKHIHYSFKDINHLILAFTHRSLARQKPQTNERLEFLGDRVLGFVISEYLFHHYPQEPEGALSKRMNALVCRESCAQIAKSLHLGDYLMISKGEEDTGGRDNPSILADLTEALIAALYLDGGIAVAKAFILREWAPYFVAGLKPPQDSKSFIQEWLQAKSLALPEYVITQETGPSHDKTYTVEIRAEGQPYFSATGKSKKEAEQGAAQKLIAYLKIV